MQVGNVPGRILKCVSQVAHLTRLPHLHSVERSILPKIDRRMLRVTGSCRRNLLGDKLRGEIAVSEGQAIMASRNLAILLPPFLSLTTLEVARAAEKSPKDMLAAQIRSQGADCNQALRATRDAKRSKPDHEVWVLQCDNATYRISRYPDLAAKIDRLL